MANRLAVQDLAVLGVLHEARNFHATGLRRLIFHNRSDFDSSWHDLAATVLCFVLSNVCNLIYFAAAFSGFAAFAGAAAGFAGAVGAAGLLSPDFATASSRSRKIVWQRAIKRRDFRISVGTSIRSVCDLMRRRNKFSAA